MKFQKFLPKKGFLNISIEKISNFKSLLESIDFGDKSSLVSMRNFSTSIYCEPFSENEDLNSLFLGFETPRIHEKLAYGINHDKSYQISMNSLILDYLQTKKLRVELRLFFKGNKEDFFEKEENKEDFFEKDENNEERKDYILLGFCYIPLIGLLINVNGEISEEFCLQNENEEICDVFVKVQMSFTEKMMKINGESINKPFAIVNISILEVICDEEAFGDLKEISFSLNFMKKIIKSQKKQFLRNKSGVLYLNGVEFTIKSENSQELTIQPLEIKVLDEKGGVIGYLNIDFSEIIKSVNLLFISSIFFNFLQFSLIFFNFLQFSSIFSFKER